MIEIQRQSKNNTAKVKLIYNSMEDNSAFSPPPHDSSPVIFPPSKRAFGIC